MGNEKWCNLYTQNDPTYPMSVSVPTYLVFLQEESAHFVSQINIKIYKEFIDLMQ